MEVSGQLHDPTTLSPRKEALVPTGWRLVGPQNWLRCGGKEKESQLLPGIKLQLSSS